jgi:hypothetical protein
MRGGGRMHILKIDGFMRSPLLKLDNILLALIIDDGFKSTIANSGGHSLELAYPLVYPSLDKAAALIDKLVWIETQRHDRRYKETLKASSVGFWRRTNHLEVGEGMDVCIVGVEGCVRILILHDSL